jgi:hypothetical protein
MLTSGVRFNDADDSTATVRRGPMRSPRSATRLSTVSASRPVALGSGTVQLDRIQVNNTVTGF